MLLNIYLAHTFAFSFKELKLFLKTDIDQTVKNSYQCIPKDKDV